MADEAHARLSPSSSDRWIACPGSIAAQAAVTEPDEGSAASRDGTVAHTLLELCVLFGFTPQQFLGVEIEKGYPVVVQHMIDGVQIALDWISEYVDTYGADNLIVLPEHRVYIGSMIGVPDELCNGTTDLQIIHKNKSRLVTFDYKHGIKPVSAKDNSQTMLYTAGGIKEHGRFREYVAVIAQPRAAKRQAVEEDVFKAPKLNKFLEKAGRAAQAALLPNAPRVAGDHCFFCKASSNCQTYRRRTVQRAQDDFAPIEDPESIPDDMVEQVLAEANLFQAWINSIKSRALRMAVAGYKFNEYTLGWGPRKRIFQDPEEVADWCRRNKLLLDEYMPRALLTPKELEGVLKKNGRYPRAKRGQPRPDSPIAHLIGYTTPKPALKARNGPAEDFDEIEDE